MRRRAPILALAAALLAAGPARGQGEEADGGSVPDGGGAPEASTLPFSGESIQGVILEHRPEVQACYEQRLAEGKNVQGEVVIAFVIEPEGVVGKARVKSSTLHDPAVEGCVLGALRRWYFPKPRRAQPVEFPFRFTEVGTRSPGRDGGAPARRRTKGR